MFGSHASLVVSILEFDARVTGSNPGMPTKFYGLNVRTILWYKTNLANTVTKEKMYNRVHNVSYSLGVFNGYNV
jgi:hypothetical protein